MVSTEIRLIIFFAAEDGEYTVSKHKTWSWLWLLIAKFRLNLKNVGKTTRPFKYGLNPYDYIMEETDRLKGLDLIACLKKYRQRFITFYRRW